MLRSPQAAFGTGSPAARGEDTRPPAHRALPSSVAPGEFSSFSRTTNRSRCFSKREGPRPAPAHSATGSRQVPLELPILRGPEPHSGRRRGHWLAQQAQWLQRSGIASCRPAPSSRPLSSSLGSVPLWSHPPGWPRDCSAGLSPGLTHPRDSQHQIP